MLLLKSLGVLKSCFQALLNSPISGYSTGFDLFLSQCYEHVGTPPTGGLSPTPLSGGFRFLCNRGFEDFKKTGLTNGF
jgi:hypothetical protein